MINAVKNFVARIILWFIAPCLRNLEASILNADDEARCKLRDYIENAMTACDLTIAIKTREWQLEVRRLDRELRDLQQRQIAAETPTKARS